MNPLDENRKQQLQKFMEKERDELTPEQLEKCMKMNFLVWFEPRTFLDGFKGLRKEKDESTC